MKMKMLAVMMTVYVIGAKLDKSTAANTCGNLLSSGHVDASNRWRPDGCVMQEYTRDDATSCFRRVAEAGARTHIAFLGDSRMRNLYWALVTLVSPPGTSHPPPEERRGWCDYDFALADTQLYVQSKWEPYVGAEMGSYFDRLANQSEPPSIVVGGSATWSMKAEPDGFRDHVTNLTRLVPAIDRLNAKDTKVIWTLQDPIIPARAYERKINFKKVTNEKIYLYNEATKKTLRTSRALVWYSMRRIGESLIDDSTDGLHAGDSALDLEVQILLNLLCNRHMEFDSATCCVDTSGEWNATEATPEVKEPHLLDGIRPNEIVDFMDYRWRECPLLMIGPDGQILPRSVANSLKTCSLMLLHVVTFMVTSV